MEIPIAKVVTTNKVKIPIANVVTTNTNADTIFINITNHLTKIFEEKINDWKRYTDKTSITVHTELNSNNSNIQIVKNFLNDFSSKDKSKFATLNYIIGQTYEGKLMVTIKLI